MRIALMLALVLISPACEDKESKATSGGRAGSVRREHKPTGTPRPQDKLTVTLDSTPVTMVNALAWRTTDGMVRVTVSSVPVGCDEVTGKKRRLHEGEVTFDVSLSSTALRGTHFRGMTAAGLNERITVTGDGTPGQPTTADVAFETTSAGREEHKLTVKGTIDALGCARPAE